jgi:hypothetical protein
VLAGAFTPGVAPLVIATTSDDNFDTDDSHNVDRRNHSRCRRRDSWPVSPDRRRRRRQRWRKISVAIEQVGGNRAEYGSLANRLEYTVSNLMNVAEFTTSARSRIEDADFAAESARLAKAQVLQQTGTAMLAQANAASQLAIQLIR